MLPHVNTFDMQNESNNYTETNTQEQQLSLLNDLLSYTNANDLREDATNVFYGYLASDYADDQRRRQRLNEYHFQILLFFKKLAELQTLPGHE